MENAVKWCHRWRSDLYKENDLGPDLQNVLEKNPKFLYIFPKFIVRLSLVIQFRFS